MSEFGSAKEDLHVYDTSAPKRRTCLRCLTEFESEWAGERICTRCKGTAAWKAGTSAQSHPVGRR